MSPTAARAQIHRIRGELLAQGQVLESELMVAADEEREEPERVE
jgi:hypothetical protein